MPGWIDRKEVFSGGTSNWTEAGKAHRLVLKINAYQRKAQELGIKSADTQDYVHLLGKIASKSARAAQHPKKYTSDVYCY